MQLALSVNGEVRRLLLIFSDTKMQLYKTKRVLYMN